MRRLDFGYFVRPPAETGTGSPRVEPCLGYLLRHPRGVLLFDTGMGASPGVDARYQPRSRPLASALAEVDASLEDVNSVTNCHLHFDHCGGNPAVADKPVFVQRTELSAARQTAGYTLPELVANGQYEEIDGEAEILPGVFLIPTPGHTAGHQSLVVRRSDGAVIVLGKVTIRLATMPPGCSPSEPIETVMQGRSRRRRRGCSASRSSIPAWSTSPTTTPSGNRSCSDRLT